LLFGTIRYPRQAAPLIGYFDQMASTILVPLEPKPALRAHSLELDRSA
jgi:hypothetical protein